VNEVQTRTKYAYDAENRLSCVWGTDGTCTSANAVLYLYDAQGQRVGKQQANTLEDYVYDLQGHITSVHDGGGTLLRTELYIPGGRHVATADWSGSSYSLFWNHTDWLGTERVRTNSSGVFIQGFTDSPYGMNLAYNPASDVSPMHFTGKQRDYESGLDFFEARYFGGGNNLGRFMTPDPLGGGLADPQTLNKYAYVRNNPLSLTDPTGLYICTGTQDQCKKFEITLDSLRSRKGDVGRAATAYGAKGEDNGVTVGFADLSKKGEGGNTVSTIGADSNGNLRANSDVTINSKINGDSYAAAIGHEGSHAADAQDVVKSGLSGGMIAGQPIHAGMDITHYQSEVRAWGVTQSILQSGNFTQKFGCGLVDCTLGANVAIGNDKQLPAQLGGVIDTILANQPIYNQGGKPMGPGNQGGNIVNGVSLRPNASVPH